MVNAKTEKRIPKFPGLPRVPDVSRTLFNMSDPKDRAIYTYMKEQQKFSISVKEQLDIAQGRDSSRGRHITEFDLLQLGVDVRKSSKIHLLGNEVVGEFYQEGNSFITADSITSNLGTVASGTVADTFTINDVYYQVTEIAGGAGGFDQEFNFTLANNPGKLFINGRYQGNVGHNVLVLAWNYTAGAWQSFTGSGDDMAYSTVDEEFIFDYNDLFALHASVITDYISGTDSKIQIIHAAPGIGTHNLYIDHIIIAEQQYVLTTAGTHVVIDGMTEGGKKNITLDAAGGTMKAIRRGWYPTIFNVSFTGTDLNIIEFHLFKNGEKVTKAGLFRKLEADGDFAVAVSSSMQFLIPGDVLDVRATGQVDGIYISIESINFNTFMIGG